MHLHQSNPEQQSAEAMTFPLKSPVSADMGSKTNPRKLRKKKSMEALGRQQTKRMKGQAPILPLSLVPTGPLYSYSCASMPHSQWPDASEDANGDQIMVTKSVAVNERAIGDAPELIHEVV